jgi:(2Fe-2S) ferredoxin
MMDVWMQKQMFDTVRLSAVQSCMGPCGSGACVAVYPDNVWYGGVTQDDIEEIFTKHLKNGTPVDRLQIPEEMI